MDVHIGHLFPISKLKNSTALSFLPAKSGRFTPTPPRRAVVTDPVSLKKKTRNVADVSRHVGAMLPTAMAGATSSGEHVTMPLVQDLPTEKTAGTHAHSWRWSPSTELAWKAAMTKRLFLKLLSVKTALKKT